MQRSGSRNPPSGWNTAIDSAGRRKPGNRRFTSAPSITSCSSPCSTQERTEPSKTKLSCGPASTDPVMCSSRSSAAVSSSRQSS